jgi:hypothetical protein
LHGLQAAAQGLHGLQAAAQGLHGLQTFTAQGLHGLHGLHGLQAAAQGLHWASCTEVSAALAVATGNATADVASVATLRATRVSLSIKSSRLETSHQLEKPDLRRRL